MRSINRVGNIMADARYWLVKNVSGGTLDAGTLVYIAGYDATLGCLTVRKADADSNSTTAHFAVEEAIGINRTGYVVGDGIVGGLVTTGRTVGDVVYLSGTAGAWTATPPTSGVVQAVGTVVKVHASQGKIYFFPIRRVLISNSTLTGLSATITELNYLAGVSSGAAAASKALVTGSGKGVTGLGTLSIVKGAATPGVALRIGETATEGLEFLVYDEVLTLTNAVSKATNLAIPAGAVVVCAQANLQSAVTGDASGVDALAKVGLGVSGSEVKYGVTSGLTKNLKIDTIPTYAVSSGETLVIYGIKTDGSTPCTEKFVAGGTVRVHVVYKAPNSLDDAA